MIQAVTDLVEVAERLPVRPDQAEEVARILDQLSEEISEAAAMLRQTTQEARATNRAVSGPPRRAGGRDGFAPRYHPRRGGLP